jgi:hypothetical protein
MPTFSVLETVPASTAVGGLSWTGTTAGAKGEPPLEAEEVFGAFPVVLAAPLIPELSEGVVAVVVVVTAVVEVVPVLGAPNTIVDAVGAVLEEVLGPVEGEPNTMVEAVVGEAGVTTVPVVSGPVGI